jgi:hypothetical protein
VRGPLCDFLFQRVYPIQHRADTPGGVFIQAVYRDFSVCELFLGAGVTRGCLYGLTNHDDPQKNELQERFAQSTR